MFIALFAMRTEDQNTKQSEKAETSDLMNRVAEAYKLQTELVSFYAWRQPAEQQKQ